MTDNREPLGRLVHAERLAVNAEREKPFGVEPWERRTTEQQELDMRIGGAVAAHVLAGSWPSTAVRDYAEAERERANGAEARLAEVRQTIAAFFTHHGNSAVFALQSARDLAEGIRQVLDRAALEALEAAKTQDRSDEKEAAQP